MKAHFTYSSLRLSVIILSIFTFVNFSTLSYTPNDTLFKRMNKTTDPKELADIYNEFGRNLLYRYPDSAKIFIDKAFCFADRINDNYAKVIALTNLGFYYAQHGDYISSGKYLSSARNIATKEDDNLNLAIIYSCLASNYDAIKLTSKSIEFHNKSYEISVTLQNEYNAYSSLIAIANSYLEEKKLSKVEEYVNKINGINIKYLYSPLALEYYFVRSQIKMQNNDYQGALKYLDSAHFVSWETGNMFGQVKCNNLYSSIYYNLQKYQIALTYARTAEKIARSINDRPGQMQLYYNMALIYRDTRDYKKSNFYFSAFEKIKESLFSENIINNIQIIQSQFEFDQSKSILEKKDYEAKRKISDINQKEKFIYSLIIAFLIGSILIYLLYQAFRRIKHNTILLNDRNEEISKISETLELQNHDLELLNETKDKFFSIIGHDLRNPIGGIKNLTDLLISNSDDFQENEEDEIVFSINKSIVNTYALLENLLQWAKAQNGGIEYSPESIKINTIIKRSIDLIKHSALQKHITIEFQESELYAISDYNLLDTVCRNLLSNAVKFTPISGRIQITIIHTKSASEMEFIQICIKDTGVGMNNEKVESLFKVSNNISTKGTLNETGTGLGLILCKEFVEIMGGRIWVESEEGKGSTFIFTLPVQ